jgi:ketosteroid isomerase-like protein
MSEADVQLVRSLMGPFDGIDVAQIDWSAPPIRELVEGMCSPDVELTTLESAAGSGPSRSYSGWDGVIRYLQEWFEPFSEYHMELDYIDAGDRVLVPMQVRATGELSGAVTELELVMVYEVRDGKFARISMQDTIEDARAAGGRD